MNLAIGQVFCASLATTQSS